MYRATSDKLVALFLYIKPQKFRTSNYKVASPK